MSYELQQAINEALQLSREYKDREFYVFRSRGAYVVTGNPFVIKERILDHETIMVICRNGFIQFYF